MIIGVLVGPTVVSCFNSDENLGMCLRGKMSEAGLFPQQATALADPAAPEAPAEPATDADAVADLQSPDSGTETAAVGEPALDVTAAPAADEPAESDELVAATFGLLRAEPDGSVVIAGSGTPGTEVEVYADDTLLGTATVESSGDWVVVPDQPVPTGGVEITLAEAGKQGRAAESFVVVIDEDRSGDPLVVASTPGQASEILQGLEQPERMDVATAEQATTAPAPDTRTASQTPADPASTQEGTDAQAPAPAATAAPEQPPSAESDVAPVPDTDIATAEPSAEPAAPTATEEQPTDVPEQPLPEQAAPTAAAAEGSPESNEPAASGDASSSAGEPAQAVASDEPPAAPDSASSEPTAAPAADASATPPTIDAIEVEEGRTFFAGSGPEGATMRLYVDDTFVADSVVEGGRWLVEAGNVLTKAAQRVRIDMLGAGSADVAARAEVNFVIDLPEEGAPTAIATADVPESPATASEAAAPAPEATAQPADSSAEATTQPAPTPAATTAAADTEPAPPAAPDTQPASETAASATAPAVPTPSAEPAAPQAEPAATPVPAEQPAPAAPAEAAAPEADVPTLVAVSVGGPDAERFAAGKAIIRRGDNLWTIARRVYGEGIKYTTIYEANTGQIRDPDRIYPGQVFDLPTGEN